MNRQWDGSVFVPALRERRLQGQKLVVVLEDACLEVVHVGEGRHEVLSGTKAGHRRLLRRAGRAESRDLRPDIVYQCLCALLESPINRSGGLLLYIHTQNGLMIEVNPQLRCPRTYTEFESLFGTLLVKRNVRARGAKVTLLQIVKNDLSQILPPGCRKIGLEVHGRHVDLNHVQQDLQRENKNVCQPIVVFIGAVAHGSPIARERNEFVEDELCISKYHLSAAECCHRICHAVEQVWL
ncbi:putative ribosome biogenesis protein NEP1 [Gregarina niphandrodes]|uniref:Ribosome biogenesis protein NEP1 n=1 Tax=Gregarina niphandrodes TaxID=110365 RepID=A0A023AZF8_GRENI|nr:putative ribosome biogenesis protein NEP1 [Gregarina niphandrodes]EZG43863.1 putative ribosome biogenesis protein NEP1 [Gregarina niphandrodes]|eukprot:XP_011132951.1 putative ribosome biogenesis protein NEP1 [Gregarina niphandrodes]